MGNIISRSLKYYVIISVFTACKNSHSEKQLLDIPESPSTEANQNYELVGNGDSTLVFIHGWNIDESYWDSQMDYFSKKYRTLAVNLITPENSKDSLRN